LVSGRRVANRYSLPLGSFGLGTLRGANRYRLPLGSFGLGALRVANRYRPPLGSFGLGALRVANRYSLPLGSFGLGTLRGANRYRLPLGSSENRGRHDCNHASSAPPGPRPFSWGGVTIPMVMTVRLVSGASQGANRYYPRQERFAFFPYTSPTRQRGEFATGPSLARRAGMRSFRAEVRQLAIGFVSQGR
jgi:hypothetical protein